ncbi:MAG: YicC/YloC family endoribonuclease [Bacteroidota bacterium]
MLRSMTGYGQAEIDTERFTIKAEFKSLNNKFLEVSLRLPKIWQSLEHEVRKEITKLVERGSCQVNINVQFKKAEDKVLPINKDVATYYLQELGALCDELGMNKTLLANGMFQMPNLFQPADTEMSEEDAAIIMQVMNKAFVEFEKFRMKEGDALADELKRMTQSIVQIVKEIEQIEPERMDIIKGRIEGELEQLKQDNLDKNRFEQELIYYIEKLDISEEKTRLIQHCNYFLECMNNKSAGKKLGFIAQEMGREINTIGSKANHFKIQQRVVEMKDELEKIKEQLNNIV